MVGTEAIKGTLAEKLFYRCPYVRKFTIIVLVFIILLF